jgi:D-alanyl-D-alanine dipeptidase
MRAARYAVTALAAVAATALGCAGAAGAAEPRAPAGAFVSLQDVAPTILVEMRYRTAHNFVGRRIPGYREPACLLTRQAAAALARVQAEVARRGSTLKVYDCYRPQRAVDAFVAWAKRLADQRMKREFYPRVDKRALFRDGYIARRSGHSRGSTVDLTLVRRPPGRQDRYRRGMRLADCTGPRRERFRDNSIDMGTGYDCFDPRAHPFSASITGRRRANRLTLRRAMLRQGFEGLDTEWWHFTLRDEPFPDTFFDFPVARASLPAG